MIRKFQEDDAQKVSDLIRVTLKKVNKKDYSEEQIEQWGDKYTPDKLKDLCKKWLFFVATVDNEIVGVGACYRDHAYSVFVKPDYENKGIGKELMHVIEKEITKNGFSKACADANITALKFYQRIGYEIGYDYCNESGMKIYKMSKNLV